MLKRLAHRLLTKGPFGPKSGAEGEPDIVDGKLVTPANTGISEFPGEVFEVTFDKMDSTLLKMDTTFDFNPEISISQILKSGVVHVEATDIAPAPLPAEVCADLELKGEIRAEKAEEKAPDIKGFWLHLTAKGRAPRTIKEYQYEMTWWQKVADEQGKDLLKLTVEDMEAATVGLHSATARRKAAALRTYARWAMRSGATCLFLEMQKVEQPPLPVRLPKDLGPEMFRELYKMAKILTERRDRCGLWIGLMLCGGLRISEIQTARKSAGMIKVVGKGNKERLVPVPEWIREGMTKIKETGNGGWRQKKQNIWNQLDKVGIRKPHSLRHTYASELLRRGYALEDVQKLLGHTRIDTTTVYANVQIPEGVVDTLDIH